MHKQRAKTLGGPKEKDYMCSDTSENECTMSDDSVDKENECTMSDEYVELEEEAVEETIPLQLDLTSSSDTTPVDNPGIDTKNVYIKQENTEESRPKRKRDEIIKIVETDKKRKQQKSREMWSYGCRF